MIRDGISPLPAVLDDIAEYDRRDHTKYFGNSTVSII